MDDADAVMSDTVGRVRDKKEPSVLMPINDGWRVESCPPVANGPRDNLLFKYESFAESNDRENKGGN